MLQEAVMKLGEHFDAVQILGSWMNGGHTRCAKRGSGNFYARQGMAREFIEINLAEDQAAAIAERLNPPDEGDNWKKDEATP